jgi:hypothetical protein
VEETIMKKSLILVVLLLLSLNSICPAADITTNVLKRVFFISYGESAGTGFTIDVDGRQYLITAKHVVGGIKDKDTIKIKHDNQMKPLSVRVIWVMPEEADIIVLAPEVQISPSFELEPTMKNLILGQQMYFLGFPFGIGMNDKNTLKINNGYPLPLVKDGVLSGLSTTEGPNKYTVLVLDGLNNEGFSGGPIVYKEQSSNKLNVCGVVSSYKAQEIPVYRKAPLKKTDPKTIERTNPKTGEKYKLVETDMIVERNTGLAYGHGISVAVEAIRKNPIGPEIKK